MRRPESVSAARQTSGRDPTISLAPLALLTIQVLPPQSRTVTPAPAAIRAMHASCWARARSGNRDPPPCARAAAVDVQCALSPHSPQSPHMV
ncbi:MAG: hypothetical protein OZ935_01920 [Pseudomonadota bacterium]|nr:hypothetical protein [Pseudomonadota bacterium]